MPDEKDIELGETEKLTDKSDESVEPEASVEQSSQGGRTDSKNSEDINRERLKTLFTHNNNKKKKFKCKADRSQPVKIRSIIRETGKYINHDAEQDMESEESKHGWTNEKKDIIANWLEELNNISFVYDKKLQNIKFWANCTSFSILFLTTISSYFSLSQLNISDEDSNVANFVRYTLLCINCSTAFISGSSKICNFENKIEALSKYKQKLDEIESVFLTELTIPSNLRKNADDFLRTHSVSMQKVMTEYPEISDKEYMRYTKSYIEHLYKNMELNEHKEKIRRYEEKGSDYMNRGSPTVGKYTYDSDIEGEEY